MANDSNAQFLAVLNRLALVGERLVAAMEAGKGGGGGGAGTGLGGSMQTAPTEKTMPAPSLIGSVAGNVSSVASAGMSAVSSVVSTASSLSGLREFQSQISGPVEAGYREISEFSKKGITLQEDQVQTVADQVEAQQRAAKNNMRALRPLVDEGLIGNIMAKLGEEWADMESPKMPKGLVVDMAKEGATAAITAPALQQNASSFLNVDAFGR